MAVLRVPADFDTIQAAVEAARPGDTIRVAGGVYGELVRIGAGKDGLAIIGPGPGSAILRGQGRGAGFLIEGSGGVTIAGFTVTGYAEGVVIFTSDNVIRDVAASACTSVGIFVAGGALRNLLLHVVAGGNPRAGIVAAGQNAYLLSSELAANGNVGADFSGFRHVAIGNRATGNGTGLDASGTNFAVVAHNSLVGNGSGLSGEGDLVYANSMMRSQRAGAELIFSGFAVLLENEVRCNLGPGMFLAGAGSNRLLRNVVAENGMPGIDIVVESIGNVIDDNEIKENGAAGIRLEPPAVGNAIRRNELKRNQPDIEAQSQAGADNVFDENHCSTSVPFGLCCPNE